MKYMLLLYSAEDAGPQPGTDEQAAEMQEWFGYTEALQEAGALAGGEALQPIATSTTLKVRDGKSITTDGPFAETKEVLGGFYLIDVADLDEAREWAAKVPSSTYGTVEIRPIMSFD